MTAGTQGKPGPATADTIDPPERLTRSERSFPCLTILFHPEVERVGERLVLFRRKGRGRREVSRTAGEFGRRGDGGGRALDWPTLSRKPLWFTRAGGGGVILAPEPGGSQVLVDGRELRAPLELGPDALERGVVLVLGRSVTLLLHGTEDRDEFPPELDMVGRSDVMEGVRTAVLQVARNSAPVLLLGETGVGKELVARAIHAASPRREGPFVCVNLAAVPSTIAASSLFGHLPGSFTGASHPHRGFFEQADGGTLFLDEVGVVPLEVQAALLRVLDTGEIQALGARSGRQVDVRVVAATDEDLQGNIATGNFRASFYHRLSGYTIDVPPLRRRREDIGCLLIHFLRQELRELGAEHRLETPAPEAPSWLPALLVADLAAYPWPGNVRQLRNLARRLAVAHADHPVVDGGRLLKELRRQAPESPAASETGDTAGKGHRSELRSLGAEELVRLLEENDFCISSTARRLGVCRNTLYSLIDGNPLLKRAGQLGRAEVTRALEQSGGDVKLAARRLKVSARALRQRLRELELHY